MKRVGKTVTGALLLVMLVAGMAAAQRARTVGDPTERGAAQPAQNASPAPQTVRTKYEGGVFGYNRKMDGTLTFDDDNDRLLFRNERGQEVFSIPYQAIVSAFADTQSRRPTAASVIGSASIYTLPALLIRRNYRYLTLQYRDPDTNVEGTTSFKMENKEILDAVLRRLANEAGLTPRGEVFVRRRDGEPAVREQHPATAPDPSSPR